MAQLQIDVSVTNASAEVTIPGALVAADIDEGDLFKVYSQNGGQGIYHVGSAAESGGDTVVQLTAPYQGATATGVTGIFHRDFTAEQGYPLMSDGDLDAAAILSRMAAEVDEDVEARPTVAQFGGTSPAEIGRGAIVESGSNSNGHYVRWENGEQKTRQRVLVAVERETGGNDQSYSFPADFSQDPVRSITPTDIRGGTIAPDNTRRIGLYGESLPSPSGGRVRLHPQQDQILTTEESVEFDVIAWGFWK